MVFIGLGKDGSYPLTPRLTYCGNSYHQRALGVYGHTPNAYYSSNPFNNLGTVTKLDKEAPRNPYRHSSCVIYCG